MKVIEVTTDGRYTHHGIGYTEHEGYHGTADNRMSIKRAIRHEYNYISDGEDFMIQVNGSYLKNGAIFHKSGIEDFALLNY
jgi:hypothetical protein